MPTIETHTLKVSIVIPAFNEAGALGEVIAEIRKHCEYPIFVVDDASTDDTAAIARSSGVTVIPLVNQMGAWGATQAGIRYAERHGYTTVVAMDADGQHDPASIGALLEPLRFGDADVCIGSCTERGSVMRQIAWKMLRKVSGLRIEDLTSGFRAYNQTAITDLASWRATFLDFQDVGVLALLMSRQARIVDIKTEMRSRRSGHSRVFHSWLVVSYYMCHSLLLGFTKYPIRRYRAANTSEMK